MIPCLPVKVQLFCLHSAVFTQKGFPCKWDSPHPQTQFSVAVENRAVFLLGKVTLLHCSVVKRSGFWPETEIPHTVAAHWLLLVVGSFREGSTNLAEWRQYSSLVSIPCDSGRKSYARSLTLLLSEPDRGHTLAGVTVSGSGNFADAQVSEDALACTFCSLLVTACFRRPFTPQTWLHLTILVFVSDVVGMSFPNGSEDNGREHRAHRDCFSHLKWQKSQLKNILTNKCPSLPVLTLSGGILSTEKQLKGIITLHQGLWQTTKGYEGVSEDGYMSKLPRKDKDAGTCLEFWWKTRNLWYSTILKLGFYFLIHFYDYQCERDVKDPCVVC